MKIEVKRELVKFSLAGPRKLGALYLVGPPIITDCDRLPFDLAHCPTCGHGWRPTRIVQNLDSPRYLFGGVHDPCAEGERRASCPICWPGASRQLIAWTNKLRYTAATLARECKINGRTSWKTSQIPRILRPGKTIVYCAISKPQQHIFGYFRVDGVEIVLRRSDCTKVRLARCILDGITPYYVEDEDPEYSQTFTAERSDDESDD